MKHCDATLHHRRFKDRTALKTAGRVALQEADGGTSKMRISSAQRSDAGLYVCKIINTLGAEQAECRLEVNGEGQASESAAVVLQEYATVLFSRQQPEPRRR